MRPGGGPGRLDRASLLRASAATALGTVLGARLLGRDDEAEAAVDLASACVLTPEATEGPFYVDLGRIRNDIREAKAGLRLRLDVTVVDSTTCAPLPNAAVDIWHADAGGVYSGVSQQDSVGQTFLRGIQIANDRGVARFVTIYPGWYPGRATHIHVKVHVGGTRAGSTYSGGHVAHTGQIFFPDALTDTVMARAPYRGHTGRRTRNGEDGIFAGAGGSRAIAKLTPLVAGTPGKGYAGRIALAVDPEAEPSSVGP